MFFRRSQTHMVSPISANTGMVESGLALVAAHHVDGPTLSYREPAFGRGLASIDRAPTCTCRSKTASAVARPSHKTFLQRIAAFFLLVSSVLLVSGCGSGGEETAAADGAVPTDPATAAQTTGNTVDPAAGSAVTDPTTGLPAAAAASGSEISSTGIGEEVKTSSETPKDFTNAVGKKAIVVFIYQPTSDQDELLKGEVQAAVKQVGKAVFLQYNAGDHKSYRDLPTALNLWGSPGVAVVSRSGKLQNFWIGYVDDGLLARAIQKANAAQPSKVTPSTDAPPLSSGGTTVSGTDPATTATAGGGLNTGL